MDLGAPPRRIRAREGNVTRAEHLQWSKERALEYLEKGDLANGLASFMSDLGKHDEMAPLCEIARRLLPLAMSHVAHGDYRQLRIWIEGFN